MICELPNKLIQSLEKRRHDKEEDGIYPPVASMRRRIRPTSFTVIVLRLSFLSIQVFRADYSDRKVISFHAQEIIMKTVEMSDAAYKELLSRRIGRESISKTILRELKPVQYDSKALEELKRIEKGTFCSLDEAEKKYGI